MQQEKPSLPSIKQLLEGGPGMIDYTVRSNRASKPPHLLGHRRHASEHIPSSFRRGDTLPPMLPLIAPLQPPSSSSSPPVPSTPSSSSSIASTHTSSKISSLYHSNVMALPLDMQSLSISKPATSHTTSRRRRTHSRSYSDFAPRYPFATYKRMAVEGSFGTAHSSADELDMTEEEEEDMDINSSSSSPTPHRFILDLNNNVSYQQGAAKYICPYCQKAFTRPSSLRTHTYSHTGEKPFECTEEGCGRKFSVQSNLRRHLRIHRLNRPMSVGYASASSNSSVSK